MEDQGLKIIKLQRSTQLYCENCHKTAENYSSNKCKCGTNYKIVNFINVNNHFKEKITVK